MNSVVGRQREIELLNKTLTDAFRGHGAVMLVTGEAGIGKTTLVRELELLAGRHDALILKGHCFDLSTTTPLGPWREIARSFDRKLPERFHSGFTELWAEPETWDAQESLHEQTLSFLADIATESPVLLVLEDLHWADFASLELLRFLSRNISDDPILIVGTYRDDEVQTAKSMFGMLPSLVRESSAVRIALQGLNEASVTELIERRYQLPTPARDQLVDYILRWSGGNPLFTVELLHTLEQDGVLFNREAGWTLENLNEIRVPRLIRQIVELRLDLLPESSRAVLRMAAVIGFEVQLRQLERLAPEQDAVAAVDQGIKAHLLEESPDGHSLQFRHALVREAIYRTLTISERRRAHVLVAESMIDLPNPSPDAIAFHLRKAGDDRACHWYLVAGEIAEKQHAWFEAVASYEAAIELARTGAAPGVRVAGPLLRCGQLLRITAPERGMTCLQEAYDAASADNDEALANHVLFHIGQMQFAHGRRRSGVELMGAAAEALNKGLKQTPELERWALQLLPGAARNYPLEIINGTLALYLAAVGRCSEAAEVAERCLSVDWKQADSTAGFQHVVHQTRGNHDGFHALGIAMAGLGNPDDSRLAFSIAREQTNALDFSLLSMLVAQSALSFLYYPCLTTRTEDRKQLVEVVLAGWQSLKSDWRTLEGWMLEYPFMKEGKWTELQRLADENPLSNTPLSIPQSIFQDFAVRTRARLAALQGKVELAWELIDTMFPFGSATEPGEHVFVCATDVQRLATELAIDDGNLERAHAWLEAHERWLDWNSTPVGRADSLLLRARISLTREDTEAASALAMRARTEAMNPSQPVALLAIDRFRGRLATMSDETATASEILAQTLKIADECALPFERAETMLALIELDLAMGNEDLASQRSAVVRPMLDELEAAPALERLNSLVSPRKSRPTANRFGITQRELEVLRLLVEGRTDREIGEELFISHHTVMNHVSRILAKLDVESRTAAATAAVRNNLV